MITYVDSNLFESPAKVWVNTVNTVGVMGKGIAKTFKAIYPEMFKQYKGFCEDGSLTVGKLWLYKTSHKWILNFPTKKHWRNKSRLEYIEAGLRKFADSYDRKSLLQVSFPMLGCGNGDLDWDDVRPLMEQYLRPLPIDVYIHQVPRSKNFVPEHKDIEAMKRWLHSEPRSLPFSEFWDDICDVVGMGIQLKTIGDDKSFSLLAEREAFRLRIVFQDNKIEMGQEELEWLWGNIRLDGFYSSHSLPDMQHAHMPYVSAMLERLPYVRQVMASESAEAKSNIRMLMQTGYRRVGQRKPLSLMSA